MTRTELLADRAGKKMLWAWENADDSIVEQVHAEELAFRDAQDVIERAMGFE